MPTTAGVTAKPWCDYCMTGMASRLPGSLRCDLTQMCFGFTPTMMEFSAKTDGCSSMNGNNSEISTQCALICTASTTKAPFSADGCPAGATCKSFGMDPDPCETAHVELPCAKTKTCGLCSFP